MPLCRRRRAATAVPASAPYHAPRRRADRKKDRRLSSRPTQPSPTASLRLGPGEAPLSIEKRTSDRPAASPSRTPDSPRPSSPLSRPFSAPKPPLSPLLGLFFPTFLPPPLKKRPFRAYRAFQAVFCSRKMKLFDNNAPPLQNKNLSIYKKAFIFAALQA